MEDHVGPGKCVPPGPAGAQQFAEIAADHAHPRVGGEIRGSRHPVEERQPGQRPVSAARHVERARGQQLPGEA
jgi:hypothetical protein